LFHALLIERKAQRPQGESDAGETKRQAFDLQKKEFKPLKKMGYLSSEVKPLKGEYSTRKTEIFKKGRK
tara:strand:+ start:520 stop:726 length:207 start_codon:yes stop_codon:yes gene_type:complete